MRRRAQIRMAALRPNFAMAALLLVCGTRGQEACDGAGPPPATAQCTAAHDIFIAFDTTINDNPLHHDGLTALLNTIVGAYELGATATGPRIALLRYDNSAQIIADLTDSAASLSDAIANRQPSTGTETCIYCALETAQEAIESSDRPESRKVILLLIENYAV